MCAKINRYRKWCCKQRKSRAPPRGEPGDLGFSQKPIAGGKNDKVPNSSDNVYHNSKHYNNSKHWKNQSRDEKRENRRIRRRDERRLFRQIKSGRVTESNERKPPRGWSEGTSPPDTNTATGSQSSHFIVQPEAENNSNEIQPLSMNESSESSGNQKLNISKYGKKLIIGTLNSQGRKLEEITIIMKKIDIDMLCVQEAKIPTNSSSKSRDYTWVTSTDVGNDSNKGAKNDNGEKNSGKEGKGKGKGSNPKVEPLGVMIVYKNEHESAKLW